MRKKQILIVEDERIVAADIKMSVEKLGFEVAATANSGEEAIQKALELKPDLVLMDVVLEGRMDGIKAASIIRASCKIPIIYLTAYSDDKTLQRAKITEPFGYIIKPFQDRELHSIIEIALYKHRMERKLAENEERLSTILKSINDAVIATDPNGRVTFMNPVAQALTGWTQKHAKGRHLKDVFIIMDVETGVPVEDPVSRVLKKEDEIEAARDATLIARDGTEYTISFSCAPIQFDTGRMSGAVLAFQDISERKKVMDELKKAYADLKATQQELIQSEKLAALGRFSSGVAHEIKNPLGVILGGTEFLENKFNQAEPDLRKAIEKIKYATRRANTIVQDMLKFAKPSDLKAEKIRLKDMVKETLSLLEFGTSLKNIKIETYFPREGLSIEVDKNQIQQVFFNLMMNAVDAMPRGGKLRIKAYEMEEPGNHPDGRFCAIEIKDSGEGIPEENLKRLFEPFFTTKRDKKGIGLGLSMAKIIVENHKGNLEIDSTLGEGTTAKIVLPYI